MGISYLISLNSNPLFKNIPNVGYFWHSVVAVFVYLCICICGFVYLILGNNSFDILRRRAFSKRYGLLGLKDYIVEMSRLQKNGQTLEHWGRFCNNVNIENIDVKYLIFKNDVKLCQFCKIMNNVFGRNPARATRATGAIKATIQVLREGFKNPG